MSKIISKGQEGTERTHYTVMSVLDVLDFCDAVFDLGGVVLAINAGKKTDSSSNREVWFRCAFSATVVAEKAGLEVKP